MQIANVVNDPIVIGDYPYYRDKISLWEKKIIQIKNMGINVLTFYIPWRHHLVLDGSYNFGYDKNIANRNLKKFLKLIKKHNIYAIARPGPFIHAEVELGGLPDNISPSFNSNIQGIKKQNDNQYITSEDKKLPLPFDKEFLRHSINWYIAVYKQVISTNSFPHGPIIAIQIGNEGVFSDTNWPEEQIDFSLLYKNCFNKTKSFNYAYYQKYLEYFTNILQQHFCHVPLLFSVAPPSFKNSLTQWFQRVVPEKWNNINYYCYTSWQGNAVTEMDAFKSLLLAAKRHHAFNIEENAGFSWDDKAYKKAHTFIFHAVLHLAAGAKSFAVYPAVSTSKWDATIAANAKYLKKHPERKKYYAMPYADCAPIMTTGEKGDTYDNIKSFIAFIKRYYLPQQHESMAILLIIWPYNIIEETNESLKNQFNTELTYILENVCSLGVDFDLLPDVKIHKKILLKYNTVIILSGCKDIHGDNIKHINEFKKTNIINSNLNGGRHMFFLRKNKITKHVCVFLFNLEEQEICLTGNTRIGKISCTLPAKAILIFLLKREFANITIAYFKNINNDDKIILSLLYEDKKYLIRNGTINNFTTDDIV